MKNIKVIISLLICMLVILGASACNSVFYQYDENTETLTITGIGEMSNENYYPWWNVEKPTHIEVAQGVTSIAEECFYYTFDGNSGSDCNHFNKTETVKLANSVERIGNSAFADCSSLKEVTLPDSLKEIGKMAFIRCAGLESVRIPENVKEIKARTFNVCSSMKNVEICGAEIINTEAFGCCGELESVNLPDNLKEIGVRAFKSCESLKEIIIPKSVTYIGMNALGYTNDEHTDKEVIINGFTIKGYKKTVAEDYARENGFTFIALD